jgi:hypothetical protein
MWADQIDHLEAERLCRLWRRQGHTSAAELRALLEERAALLRWAQVARQTWETGKGRRVA